ncbi:MAG: SRPBCC family protein [Candidatus Dormibacteraeota bacterium]|uniref:SRPBCC family protein n=1 Tax=Candidatus Dormiibacter inghamiae TaxID=3127013 RepID=A0A934KCQ5_9BACT|nr:SRPBCC family protein [Candidatus Dormibacteraeota bacterium]MBJ7605800.1 SRPBCC family protein [Candidatus Dormibacteraeota bacterium]
MTSTEFIVRPGTQEVVVTRVFDAPREVVFKTITDPNLIPSWWGPRSQTTIVDKMDLRPGGVWRFIGREANGSEYAFHGVYHAIVPPERIVNTFEFEGMPGHVLMETVTLEDIDGKTRMTTKSVYQSIEDRDGMVGAGMETGATESGDRLAELLATIRS